jgi:hypothetical protein
MAMNEESLTDAVGIDLLVHRCGWIDLSDSQNPIVMGVYPGMSLVMAMAYYVSQVV